MKGMRKYEVYFHNAKKKGVAVVYAYTKPQAIKAIKDNMGIPMLNNVVADRAVVIGHGVANDSVYPRILEVGYVYD